MNNIRVTKRYLLQCVLFKQRKQNCIFQSFEASIFIHTLLQQNMKKLNFKQHLGVWVTSKEFNNSITMMSLGVCVKQPHCSFAQTKSPDSLKHCHSGNTWPGIRADVQSYRNELRAFMIRWVQRDLSKPECPNCNTYTTTKWEAVQVRPTIFKNKAILFKNA